MSTCISTQGEYSTHTVDGRYGCTRCHVLDEDALFAELDRLKTELAKALDDRDFHKAACEATQAVADTMDSTLTVVREELAATKQQLNTVSELCTIAVDDWQKECDRLKTELAEAKRTAREAAAVDLEQYAAIRQAAAERYASQLNECANKHNYAIVESYRQAASIARVGDVRNVHCSSCGNTRGGPMGHETSECTWRAKPGMHDDTDPCPGGAQLAEAKRHNETIASVLFHTIGYGGEDPGEGVRRLGVLLERARRIADAAKAVERSWGKDDHALWRLRTAFADLDISQVDRRAAANKAVLDAAAAWRLMEPETGRPLAEQHNLIAAVDARNALEPAFTEDAQKPSPNGEGSASSLRGRNIRHPLTQPLLLSPQPVAEGLAGTRCYGEHDHDSSRELSTAAGAETKCDVCKVVGGLHFRQCPVLLADGGRALEHQATQVELALCPNCPDVAMPITAVIHACPECKTTTAIDIYAECPEENR